MAREAADRAGTVYKQQTGRGQLGGRVRRPRKF